MNEKHFYTRNLPHWQPEEDYFFITYRLAGSLPVSVIKTLKEEYAVQKKLPENQSQERKEMLREFYNYWTEINKSGIKMRFELETCFEITKRLSTSLYPSGKESLSRRMRI